MQGAIHGSDRGSQSFRDQTPNWRGERRRWILADWHMICKISIVNVHASRSRFPKAHQSFGAPSKDRADSVSPRAQDDRIFANYPDYFAQYAPEGPHRAVCFIQSSPGVFDPIRK
jgi:hypothetical protein